MLVPKLVSTLRTYDRRQLARDLTAGVIVGVVALPLAIAFAIASGLNPERGLFTAIVAGFLISALGGSRVQIGGPTGAFVVIVSGIVGAYGVNGLVLATVMAGVILIAFGLLRMGAAIKFIPHPVTIGFTSGIAVIIFSNEIKDFLGLDTLDTGDIPAAFLGKWEVLARNADALNPWALAMATAPLFIIVLWPGKRIPGTFVALIATTAAARLFHLPVETIGVRFGTIHTGLPRPSLPPVSWTILRGLTAPAFTIAMLAGIESLLSAVVADGMIGGRHRSNMELVAQGVANVAAPIFGGMPATGAIARTATNINNGGRTPVAGMTHAATLLLITLFFGRWVAWVPLATLAGILVMVAVHMSAWRTFIAEFRAPKSDVAVLLTTFLLTVLVDLTAAIEVGMVLAAYLFMRRMSEVTNVQVLTHEFQDPVTDHEGDPNAIARRAVPKDVDVYEITGPFFFGAAEKFKDSMERVARVLILRLRHVPAIDSTGLHALRELVRRCRRDGTLVLLADVHAQPLMAMGRAGLLDDIGDDNIFGHVDDALNRARTHLGLPIVPKPENATPTVKRESAAYYRVSA